jgi:ABC-type phosphate transport system permease subunit
MKTLSLDSSYLFALALSIQRAVLQWPFESYQAMNALQEVLDLLFLSFQSNPTIVLGLFRTDGLALQLSLR